MSTIKVKVNGKLVEAKVEGHMRLLDLVRDTLHLSATKEGCSIGECGACTVLMDGHAVCSCLVLAGQCDEAEITTLEGLNDNPLTQKTAAGICRERRRAVRFLYSWRTGEYHGAAD